MTHALTAHLGAGDLNAAALTDFTLIADALIASAVAFPVLHGSKNSFAEQTVALRFQGAVIDGLGFFDLAIAPGANLIRGSKTNFNGLKNIKFQLLSLRY
ncbi:hypothetical protein DSECCO2_576950 [anaerobic digester metagenome]